MAELLKAAKHGCFVAGDPERPVILGSLWNGVHTQPRADFRGDDVADNATKRIMTRSGNRIQMSDKAGFETLSLATPNHNVIKLTEQADKTGRSSIFIEARTGDIVLHAPQGRVHIEALYFSKDVGPAPGKAEAVAAVAVTAPVAAATPEKESLFHGLATGLYGSTIQPLAHMIVHPVQTVEGIGSAIAHPLNTVKALGHAVSATASGIMSGDGRSIGTAIGTVGMLVIPGAGEAGVVEDAARLGQLGRLGEAADIGKAAEVSDAARATDGATSAAEAGDAADTSAAAKGTEIPTTVYRVDGRPPATIFNEGFQPKGTATDLETYVDTNSPSGFVSTSMSKEISANPDFATSGTHFYEIDRSHLAGIDVNSVYPSNPFAHEQEFAVTGGIPKEAIISAKPILDNGSLGETVLNPFYGGVK